MFWAPSRMFVLSTALDTSLRAVNGGQMTISTSLMLTSSRLRPATRSSASATVLFIFQLPAMINLRALSTVSSFRFKVYDQAGRRVALASANPSTVQRSLVHERRHTGQLPAFEKFQA